MATVEVKCRFCSQTDPVKKHGTSPSGVQRYRCHECNRSFMLNYRYKAWAPGIQEKIVSMALDGSGVRETQRQLKIARNTVSGRLKKIGTKTHKYDITEKSDGTCHIG